MVQIANLLCKTQDELEKKTRENETILKDNHEHQTQVLDLQSKLQEEGILPWVV